MTLRDCTCIRSCETGCGQPAHLRLPLPLVADDTRRNLPDVRGEHDGEAALGSARHAVGGHQIAVGLGGPGGGGLRVEANGINVILDAERRGRPRQLFWPWFGANISVLGLSYGAFALGFGISFWQAAITGLVGIIVSFLLCGFVALAGKRGSAPTMVLSRAAFGVRGNRLPALISWLMTVGWETVLTITATLATATVFQRLGWGSGYGVRVVALVVVASLTVSAGVLGFDVIMRLQRVITLVTAVLTVIYIVLVLPQIDWPTVAALPAGGAAQVVGALVFFLTGFGLGWVNVAADYSRYLPRSASARGVVGWTTFGSSVAPLVLLVMGLLLAGSSPDLASAIASDPVGAIAMTLPMWFLVPFAVVAVLGLVGGAVLDIYSSGLALLAAGLRVPRPAAAAIDGVIMIAGTVYVVFVAGNFLGEFIGFLITLGVPVAAWCGVILADILKRRSDYDNNDLYRPAGRYGDVRVGPLLLIVVATLIGWGLVTNSSAAWLRWQGYLLGPIGGRDGAWAGANLGVLVALVLPFLIILLAEHLRTDHHVVKPDRARIDHTRTHHARRRTAKPLPRFRQA
jgi:nucleobase:cation symporter-1, NCS1 family